MNLRYGSAAAMYRYLDRASIAARRKRAFRNYMRRLSPAERRFVKALKHVLLVESGPEICIRKKVISRCKIGRARYFFLLKKVDKTLPNVLYMGGRYKSHVSITNKTKRKETTK